MKRESGGIIGDSIKLLGIVKLIKGKNLWIVFNDLLEGIVW